MNILIIFVNYLPFSGGLKYIVYAYWKSLTISFCVCYNLGVHLPLYIQCLYLILILSSGHFVRLNYR
jgi:hypothetical protein